VTHIGGQAEPERTPALSRALLARVRACLAEGARRYYPLVLVMGQSALGQGVPTANRALEISVKHGAARRLDPKAQRRREQ